MPELIKCENCGNFETLLSVLESQNLRSEKLTKEHFLIVVLQKPGAIVPSITERIDTKHWSVIGDARQIILPELNYDGIDAIVNELNLSNIVAFLLLCHAGKEKGVARKLIRKLEKNQKLIRWPENNKKLSRKKLPQVICLPADVLSLNRYRNY